jgi:predicted secreted protein with PEFG-CTERM motif
MKFYLSILFLLTFAASMTGAFGELGEQNPVTVTTDKASYLDGETISITGKITDLYSGAPVSIIVKSPNGSIVSIAQVIVDEYKNFSTEIIAGGLMKSDGTYTITAQYWTEDRFAETSFEFKHSSIIALPLDEPVTDYSIPVIGWDNFIKYEIVGGTLLDITVDRDEKGDIVSPSLIISVEAVENGMLILTIPRSVSDATINGKESDFVILIDGKNANFGEKVSPTNRTLTIPFLTGTEEIRIIGTYVVPEFGSITMIVLTVAIISIIAVSAKSRTVKFCQY